MVSNLNTSLSDMTGARQTMLSWSKVIESYADIPEIYKSSCKSVLEDCLPFPHVVLVPTIKETRHKVGENLICEINDVFYVWQRIDSQIALIAYPMKSICTLEVGSILLSSWFTISGLTSDGVVSSSIIAFNTSTARHLAPFINKMRPVLIEVDEINWQAELSVFDYLSAVNFKLMNYARESLVRGEKVVCSILQPKIRKLKFTLLGREFYRTVSLAHLMLLTDKEVILIGEDEQESKSNGQGYGGVWQYIPLQNITATALTDSGNGLVILSFILAFGGQQVDRIFEVFNRQALGDFQTELKKAIG